MPGAPIKSSNTVNRLLSVALCLIAAGLIWAQETVELVTYDTDGTYTFTVPAGVTDIQIEGYGAGGRGATLTNIQGSGGGGGGGAYCRSIISVTEGETFTVIVGEGGGPANSERDGGNSQVTRNADSSVIIDAGGGTGPADNTATTPGDGGDCTVANDSAQSGQDGTAGDPDDRIGGDGGDAAGPDGGTGGAGAAGMNDGGSPGNPPGGGGGGAARQGGTRLGGEGADGQVVISEWIPPENNFLAYTTDPQDTQVGSIINTITIELRDPSNNVLTGNTDPVTIAIDNNPAGGTLSGTTTVNAFDGVVEFTDLSIDEVGDGYTLIATASGFDSATSAAFNILPFEGGFNAFDPATDPGAVSGPLHTAVADATFDFDIVAIDDNGEVDTGFAEDVSVEVIDFTQGTGCSSDDPHPAIAGPIAVAAGDWNNGRATLSASQAESWPEAGIRIIHQINPSNVTEACSSDMFAIRPATFNVTASAGGTNLNNTDPAGGTTPVHVAGQDFSLDAQAVNDAGNATTQYTGTAQAYEWSCLEPDTGCADGTFVADNWSDGGSGLITTTTASYSEAGVTTLSIQDCSFAYEADGCSPSSSRADQCCIRSQPIDVGRFIPDHFTVSATTLTNRPEVASCTSNFTYIGERLDAEFELTARNAAGDITVNYRDGLAHLTAAGQLGLGSMNDGATPQDLSADLEVIGADLPWNDGQAYTVAGIRHLRTQPEGPFDQFTAGIDPVDGDGVSVDAHDLDIDDDGSDDHVFIGSTILRFGRIAIDSRVGSELAPIELPWRTEYFENDDWQTNADDSCTNLAAGDLTVTESGVSNSFNETDSDLQLAAGVGQLHFDAPGTVGNLEVLLELDTPWPFLRDCIPADDTDICDQGDPPPPYTDNPSARASFGLYPGDPRRILIREVAP